MPYVVVTAPPLADLAAEEHALGTLAEAVAGALDLTPPDVQVALVHVACAVLGSTPAPAWPVITLHGRARPAEQTAAAVEAAARVAREQWAATDAWAQWG